MRISTGMMFDNGTTGILNNQGSLFKLQNQLSTGRRVLTPSDDPVASAQALITNQSQSVNKQYMENQGNAKSQLGLVEGNLDSLTSLLHDVRERAVQLGNAALTSKDRESIETEFQARFDNLVGIANSQNGVGQYLFSGYQGATKPFGVNGNVTAPFDATKPAVQYFGDQGERLLQVEASRQMSVTASGLDVFSNIKNGNGEFTVSTPTGTLNSGTAIADQGTILDISKWNAAPAALQPQDFEIVFAVDNSVNPPVTYYNFKQPDTTTLPGPVVVPGNSMLLSPPVLPALSAPPTVPVAVPPALLPTYAGTEWRVFTPGQKIGFSGLDPAYGTDLGAQVMVTGNPAAGDKFLIQSSSNQSIFDTVKNLISIASGAVPISSAGNTELMNGLGSQLVALDRALDNVSRVRASVGSRLQELDSLESAGSDLDLQYSTRISNLQDLDYAAAISDLSRQQMQLEAAQASFVRITGLSLFSQM